jgi:3,4-dihydroxy 2-butanone 4-phosphate synthase / GTP cyclohydrolase II
MLADLGVGPLRLLTNNPDKVHGLSGFGIEVTGRVPLPVAATQDNLRYLIAKRDRLGHELGELFVQNGTPRTVPSSRPADPAAPAAGSA